FLIGADGTVLARTGQDALGAGVQHAAGAGGEGGVEDVDGAEVIDLVKVAAAVSPQVRVGGKVVDEFAAAHGLCHGGTVAHVGEGHVKAVQRQVIDGRPRPLQHAHGGAALDEQGDEVATDEAGAAGD